MTNRIKRAVSVWLVLVLLLTFCGCGDGKKTAGSQVMDTDEQRFLWILCGADQIGAEVTVRHLKKSNDGKTVVVAAEYVPAKEDGRNVFGLVVEEPGLYEVTCTAEGFHPDTQMVMVDENRVYCIVCVQQPVESAEAN
jgi:hypothetical protein